MRDALLKGNQVSKKLYSLAVLLCISAAMMFAQEKKEKPDPALIRSLVFPGWGHIHKKQYVKGAFYIAAESFCIIQAILANNKGDKAYWNYRFASTAQDAIEFRAMTQKYDRKRNFYIFIGAGVWILSLADIYLHVKNHKKKSDKQVLIFPWWTDEEKGIGISLYIGF